MCLHECVFKRVCGCGWVCPCGFASTQHGCWWCASLKGPNNWRMEFFVGPEQQRLGWRLWPPQTTTTMRTKLFLSLTHMHAHASIYLYVTDIYIYMYMYIFVWLFVSAYRTTTTTMSTATIPQAQQNGVENIIKNSHVVQWFFSWCYSCLTTCSLYVDEPLPHYWTTPFLENNHVQHSIAHCDGRIWSISSKSFGVLLWCVWLCIDSICL